MTTNFQRMRDAFATELGKRLGLSEEEVLFQLGNSQTFNDLLTNADLAINIGPTAGLITSNAGDSFVDGSRFIQGTSPNGKQQGADFKNDEEFDIELLGELDNTFTPDPQGIGVKPGGTTGKFTVSYNDIEGSAHTWHFLLMPAIESHLRMSSGAPVVSGQGQQPPGVQPGIMVKTTMKHKNIIVPGSVNVVQTIGLESTILQLCGAFVGADGENEQVLNLGNALLYPEWGTRHYVADNALRHSWKLARSFDRDVVQPGRAVTVNLTTSVSELDQGRAIEMSYTGVIVGFKTYAVRKDRTFYCLDILMTRADITDLYGKFRPVDVEEAEEFGEGQDKEEADNGDSGARELEDIAIRECDMAGVSNAAEAGTKMNSCFQALAAAGDDLAERIVAAQVYGTSNDELAEQLADDRRTLVDQLFGAESQARNGTDLSPEEKQWLADDITRISADKVIEADPEAAKTLADEVVDESGGNARDISRADTQQMVDSTKSALNTDSQLEKYYNELAEDDRIPVGYVQDIETVFNDPSSTREERQAAVLPFVQSSWARAGRRVYRGPSRATAQDLERRLREGRFSNVDYFVP